MKLFIDDIRQCPEGWELARTVTEAIRKIYFFAPSITEISIDHDIQYEIRGVTFTSPETFEAVARFISVIYGDVPPKITVHSANPIGKENIEKILNLKKGHI